MIQSRISRIRETYNDCTSSSLLENKCRLQLDGVDHQSLVVIDGTTYQSNRVFTGKLCDGIIFFQGHTLFVAAVELKSGRSVRLSDAIEQIQGGLTVANHILGRVSEGRITADWSAILLFSGGMHPRDLSTLRNRRVSFRGAARTIEKHDCGIRLSDIMPEGFRS